MPANLSISWRARAFKLLLWGVRRRRIFGSVEGLMAAIHATRRTGAARPSAALLQTVDVKEFEISGCEVYMLRPRSLQNGPVVFYLHGGAYCRPITPQHWSFLHWLVQEVRCTVIVPLYPLSPESQCLETVKAVRNVHDWVWVSRLADNTGRREVTLVTLLMAGALGFFVAAAFADNAAIATVALGVGVVMYLTSFPVFWGSVTPRLAPAAAAATIALINSLANLGGAVGPAVVAPIKQGLGLAAALGMLGVCMTLAAACALPLVRPVRKT